MRRCPPPDSTGNGQEAEEAVRAHLPDQCQLSHSRELAQDGVGEPWGSAHLPDPRPHRGRLFQMNVGPPKKLEELDPESREYWRLLRKQNIWRHNRLSRSRRF